MESGVVGHGIEHDRPAAGVDPAAESGAFLSPINLNPESLAALRQSSEILAAVCDRAAKCDHLEARNKHLQEENDSLRARHGVLQAVIRKAREGLGNAIPECRSMSLPELVIEAAARIGKSQECPPVNVVSIALRMARHPVNDLDRVELGQKLVPHLRPGENVDTGALRILADRVEWLEGEAEQCRRLVHDVAAGRVDSKLRQERAALAASAASLRSTLDAYKSSGRMLEEKVASLTAERDALRDRVNRAEERANHAGLQAMALAGELAEARAENGRQAAVIAAMRGAGKVRIETPHTGRDNPSHFQAWMASRIDPASPHP